MENETPIPAETLDKWLVVAGEFRDIRRMLTEPGKAIVLHNSFGWAKANRAVTYYERNAGSTSTSQIYPRNG